MQPPNNSNVPPYPDRQPPPGYPPYQGYPPAPRRSGLFTLLIFLGLIFFCFMGIFVAIGSALTGLGGGEEWSSWDEQGPKVGVVEVTGVIEDAKPILETLREFAENDEVKAIVLRVDSPGGGVAASQEIYTELVRQRERKPIVVSMGSVAASGGYYISAPAHKIYANAGTITGSIGVIVNGMVMKRLFEEILHLDPMVYTSDPYKDVLSPFREPTEQDVAFIKDMIQTIKKQFVDDIERVRDIKLADVPQANQAQIVTGARAKELGLIDELGNLY